ncbi:two-component regulator propeller domain-containing protein [Aridibaculum aurantiacum]|uniref:type IX secretion system anionic LPS delivery protein PorZ n=1 Tax=Aridibaculum aurantiacum TaxID=2810307 RepID=UPI001A95F0AA|nr:two-component regulator propeller domain-containing protein [Aridibaculum aurantiacum]
MPYNIGKQTATGIPGRLITALTRLILLYLLFYHTQPATAQSQLQPIGQWREHLPYQNTLQVVATNNKVFAATQYALFSVEADEIRRYSKVTGLNEVGVQAIAWDETTQQMVIGYANSNLDILKDRTIRNIGDIKRSSINGDKTIYYIYCRNGLAYISTGLGIVVADLLRYQVNDTWRIGNNGSQVKINGITAAGQSWYAATEEGLKVAPVSGSNLSNFQNWNLVSAAQGLTPGVVRSVMTLQNQVLALKNDSIFINNGNSWSLFYNDPNWPIVSINTSNNKLLVTQRMASGNSRVIVMNNTGVIERTLAQPGVISFPRWATIYNNDVWVADFFGGLSRFGSTVERYIPNGPPAPATGEMVVHKNTLYVAAGSVNDAWNYQYNRNGIYTFSNGEWSATNIFNSPSLDTVLDFIPLAIDPSNETLWAGSYGGGLVNFTGSGISIFKQNNSSLQPAIGDLSSYRVSGLTFDAQGNLWIANYGAPQNLQVRKPDGSFRAFSVPFFHTENAISQLETDDANQVWAVSPKGNGVFVYDPGQNIDQLNDDRWKYLRSGSGNGNLPSNEVFSLAKDRNGFIWIGTARGIAVIQCPDQLFSAQGCEAVLPVIQQDRFAGFLFQDEEVRTIAVDGANRKWVGTRNGAWLISPDGDKIIYRFTQDNSPLLSNDVRRIAIDPQTSEVFISTFIGICSFRSTATEGTATNKDVLVFPNPVPPGYNGTIAIRGVSNGALVKIAELNGRLVYQVRALGGQATWDGRNYKGEKVASGVYLVLVKDDASPERLATKIVLVK